MQQLQQIPNKCFLKSSIDISHKNLKKLRKRHYKYLNSLIVPSDTSLTSAFTTSYYFLKLKALKCLRDLRCEDPESAPYCLSLLNGSSQTIKKINIEEPYSLKYLRLLKQIKEIKLNEKVMKKHSKKLRFVRNVEQINLGLTKMLSDKNFAWVTRHERIKRFFLSLEFENKPDIIGLFFNLRIPATVTHLSLVLPLNTKHLKKIVVDQDYLYLSNVITSLQSLQSLTLKLPCFLTEYDQSLEVFQNLMTKIPRKLKQLHYELEFYPMSNFESDYIFSKLAKLTELESLYLGLKMTEKWTRQEDSENSRGDKLGNYDDSDGKEPYKDRSGTIKLRDLTMNIEGFPLDYKDYLRYLDSQTLVSLDIKSDVAYYDKELAEIFKNLQRFDHLKTLKLSMKFKKCGVGVKGLLGVIESLNSLETIWIRIITAQKPNKKEIEMKFQNAFAQKPGLKSHKFSILII